MTGLWIVLGLLAAFGLFVVGVVLGACRLNARRRALERIPRHVIARALARQEREQDI